MNLAEWRAKRGRGESKTLPSGLDVILKKVEVTDLAMRGQIPNTLMGLVQEMMSTGGEEVKPEAFLNDLPKVHELYKSIAGAAIVQPRELDPDELPFEDLDYIFDYCNGEVNELKSFRQGESEPVSP